MEEQAEAVLMNMDTLLSLVGVRDMILVMVGMRQILGVN